MPNPRTLHLALYGAFCAATECWYMCENIIDFINCNLESWNISFFFVIMFGVYYFMHMAWNSICLVYCNLSVMCDWKLNRRNRPPRNQTYIITVCCHVYNGCNCISTFTVCQTEDVPYNANTGIGDFTSSTLFCVVHKLGINQYTYCDVGILKLESY